ncbi:MAG TPA: START domain-containing protein [Puia sp.]|nr:START domain-containing protein [Puia sp.]
MKTLCFCFILFQIGFSVKGQYNWVLKKDKDGIKVSSRHSDRSKFNDIKVEMDLPGNIYQLVNILLDVDKYSQWSYSVSRSELVKKISPLKLVYHLEVTAPWPVTDRDLYAMIVTNIDSVSRSIKIIAAGDSGYRPVNKNFIRIPYSKGIWDIHTISKNTVHIVYILQIDPGGSVPAWIMNMFGTRAPFITFQNLKHKMVLLNPGVLK